MSKAPPRITPLPMEQWGDAEKKALSVFVKPGAKSLQGNKDGQKDMSALGILLNHPALAEAVLPATNYLLRESELSARDRELLILRVAWLREAAYEWANHVLIGRNIGMSDEEIRRVMLGAKSADWSAKDKLLMAAVDELLDEAVLSDETWNGLVEHYNTHELMEVIVTVGAYNMMAMVFNSLGLQTADRLNAVLADFPFKQVEE